MNNGQIKSELVLPNFLKRFSAVLAKKTAAGN
jgi:hypothetical protein